MPGIPPIFHRTPRALPAGETQAPVRKPADAKDGKSIAAQGGHPNISGPMDPRKLPNGPNQLAGLLDRAPSQLKGDTLHLQDRPQAFKEGAAPTRMINGKQVSISAPMLGMKLPGGSEVARREVPPGRPERLAIEAPPPKLSQAEQNFQSMHLYQNNVQFVQHVHVHPPATPSPTQHAHHGQQAQTAHGGKPDGAAKPDGYGHDGEAMGLPEGIEGEKKGMGMGKKVLIGIAAATGLTFILPMFGSSSTPPPGGQG